MKGLRFEYERDGEQVIVIGRAEDDETWSYRVRVVDLPAGSAMNHPALVKARKVVTNARRESLSR